MDELAGTSPGLIVSDESGKVHVMPDQSLTQDMGSGRQVKGFSRFRWPTIPGGLDETWLGVLQGFTPFADASLTSDKFIECTLELVVSLFRLIERGPC